MVCDEVEYATLNWYSCIESNDCYSIGANLDDRIMILT